MSPPDHSVYYGQYHIPTEPSGRDNRDQTYPRSQATYSTPEWPMYNDTGGNYPAPYNPYPALITNQFTDPQGMDMSMHQSNFQADLENEMVSGVAQEHHYRPLPITNDDLLDQWVTECIDTLGRRSYVCRQPNCNLSFPRRNAAYSHIRKDHLGEEKSFECIVCGQLFATENTARRHRDNQQRRFTCSYCHRAFARQDYYRTHERRCQERFI